MGFHTNPQSGLFYVMGFHIEGYYVMGFHSEGGPTLWGSTVRVVLCYGVPQCGVTFHCGGFPH